MARNSGFGSVSCITVEARPICFVGPLRLSSGPWSYREKSELTEKGVMDSVDWDRAPTARDADDHRAEVEAGKVRQEVNQELDAWRLEDLRRLQELDAWCLEDIRRLQELDACCLENLRRLQELDAEAEVRQELDAWLLQRSR